MRKSVIGRGFVRWTLALVVSVALLGCRGEGAREMMSTAKFEEVQNNQEHARQLYERIRSEYPDSPEAAEAGERLKALAP